MVSCMLSSGKMKVSWFLVPLMGASLIGHWTLNCVGTWNVTLTQALLTRLRLTKRGSSTLGALMAV